MSSRNGTRLASPEPPNRIFLPGVGEVGVVEDTNRVGLKLPALSRPSRAIVLAATSAHAPFGTALRASVSALMSALAPLPAMRWSVAAIPSLLRAVVPNTFSMLSFHACACLFALLARAESASACGEPALRTAARRSLSLRPP